LLSDEDDNNKEKDRLNPDFEMGEADPEKELGDPAAGQSQPPSQQPHNLNQKRASLFRDALDLACDKLFDEISIKVMLESDDGTSRKSYTPLTEEELESYNILVDSTAKVHPSSVFFTPSPES
jgi:Zn-dependent M28 family amino/carboxypeptidase